MFRAVLRALEDAPVMPSDTLCQLYEIHVSLKTFCQNLYKKYELDGEAVQSLRGHYRKQRGGKMRELKLDRYSEKVHKDIAVTLRNVVSCSVVRQHQTESGFSVDMAVVKRRSSTVVALVEVDGSHTVMRSLDPSVGQPGLSGRVRGPILFKRHILQKHGFRLVVVSEDLWRSLADSREKRELLRELLRTAGVS